MGETAPAKNSPSLKANSTGTRAPGEGSASVTPHPVGDTWGRAHRSRPADVTPDPHPSTAPQVPRLVPHFKQPSVWKSSHSLTTPAACNGMTRRAERKENLRSTSSHSPGLCDHALDSSAWRREGCPGRARGDLSRTRHLGAWHLPRGCGPSGTASSHPPLGADSRALSPLTKHDKERKGPRGVGRDALPREAGSLFPERLWSRW